MADPKRKFGGGTFLKRLLFLAAIVYVVANPLDAATRVHDIAFWIKGFFA